MTLDDLRALREGWDFEAKKAAGRDGRGVVPESFWETYSALANTQGGRVVLGVTQRDDGAFDVGGVAEPDRVEQDLWNLLQNPQKVSVNLLGRDDVQREEIEGKTVLVIAVPRAPRDRRPVFVNGDMWSGTYIRVHEGDRLADRERIRRMVADATFEVRDDRVLEKTTPADLERETIQAYRNVFRATRPDHPWLALDDADLLRRLGAVRKDREAGAEGVTLAGLLMFGSFDAIRSVLPHYFLDYQERAADTGAIEWVDRVYPDGTWSGNVYDFYRRTIPRLTANLRVPFQLGPDLYRRDETHVHEAVREALVNALIHADFEGRLSVQILKRPDGFEFRNPGVLRLPIEQIRQGGVSDCRNRTLQKMFLMLGIGEQAGSGFSRILRAWREQHWRVPSLVEDPATDATTLHLSMASLLPDDVLADLDARFPGRFRQLDEPGRLAVATAHAEGRVTNRRLQEVTSLHPRDLTFKLRDLVAAGFLVPHGERRGTWYTLLEEPPSLPHGGSSMSQSSPQSDPSLPQSRPSLPQGNSRLPQSDVTSAAEGSSEVVPSAGRVADSRWAKEKDVRAAILALCDGVFVTVPTLAEGLRRAPRTLRENYVKPMVAERLLELQYPATPNHPGQAYRATGRTDDGAERP